jgi:hypothetical protein
MVPLQAELGFGIIIAALLINLLITAGLTYWVYKDSSGRGGDNAALWAIGTAVCCFIALIPLGVGIVVLYYFVGRPDASSSQQYGSVEEDWN